MYAHGASSSFPWREKSILSLPCEEVSLCVQSSERTFGRFQGVVEMCRFYALDTVEHLINLRRRRKSL